MRESELRRQAVRYLTDNFPGLWEKRHGSPLQRAGKWDLMLYWQGCHVEIELKVPGGHLSRPQIEWGLRAHKAGSGLRIVTDLDELRLLSEAVVGLRLPVSFAWHNWIKPGDYEFFSRLRSTLKAA